MSSGCVHAIWDVLDLLGCLGRWFVSIGTHMNARMPDFQEQLFVLILWLKDGVCSDFTK